MARNTFPHLEPGELRGITPENWVLLIMGNNKKGQIGALMNEIFIYAKELVPGREDMFDFRGTGAGPYSSIAGDALGTLVRKKMLAVNGRESSRWGHYHLTEDGERGADALMKKLPVAAQGKLRYTGFITRQMGPVGMLQYIGSVHPEYVFVDSGGDGSV